MYHILYGLTAAVHALWLGSGCAARQLEYNFMDDR